MHELSIVMGIVDLAERKARESQANAVQRIDLQIGELAGIDWNAMEFAWNSATTNTMLEGAERVIEHIPGKARCMNCNTVFAAPTFYEPCPQCEQFMSEIQQGQELRVKSIVVN